MHQFRVACDLNTTVNLFSSCFSLHKALDITVTNEEWVSCCLVLVLEIRHGPGEPKRHLRLEGSQSPCLSLQCSNPARRLSDRSRQIYQDNKTPMQDLATMMPVHDSEG